MGTSKGGGGSNGNLPLRTCPGCSVPEPYRSPDWFLVPAKPASGLNTNEMNARYEHKSIQTCFGLLTPSSVSLQVLSAKSYELLKWYNTAVCRYFIIAIIHNLNWQNFRAPWGWFKNTETCLSTFNPFVTSGTYVSHKESFQIRWDNSVPLLLHAAIHLEVSLFSWTSQNAFSRVQMTLCAMLHSSIAHSIVCTVRLFRGKMHSDWFNGIEIFFTVAPCMLPHLLYNTTHALFTL